LQKGHPRPLPLLLLFCVLIAVLVLSSAALTQSRRGGVADPLLTHPTNNVGPRTPLLPGQHPGAPLASMPVKGQQPAVSPTQGSGPDPDMPLTPNATASQELDPCTAPVLGQNRVVFVSNGEDLDGDDLIDPELPVDPNITIDFDMWLMRPDGTQQQRIIDLPGDQREPAYDPGGRLLAYASNETGTYQIYTVDVSTRVIWQITTTAGY